METAVQRLSDQQVQVLTSAPEALLRNDELIGKAVSKLEQFLEAHKDGLTGESDQMANKMLVRLKEVHEECVDRRKPLTQMFDEIRKAFTALETQIDPKNKSGVYARLQDLRNDFATKVKEEQRRAEQERQKKLAAEHERVTLKKEAEIQLRSAFSSHMDDAKRTLLGLFEGATLGSFDEDMAAIKAFPEEYMFETFHGHPIKLDPIHLSRADMENILVNVRAAPYDGMAAQYTEEIGNYKEDLLEKASGKKAELEEIEAAKAAEIKRKLEMEKVQDEAKREALKEEQEKAEEEKKRLEAERIQRQKDEEKRLAVERAAQEERDKVAAEAKAAADKTEALFQAEAGKAEKKVDVKATEGYEIKVNHNAGYMLIFQFWFEKEGTDLSTDKMDRKSLGQMKKFCERHYKKTGEKIESKFIEYLPVYTTRAVK